MCNLFECSVPGVREFFNNCGLATILGFYDIARIRENNAAVAWRGYPPVKKRVTGKTMFRIKIPRVPLIRRTSRMMIPKEPIRS